MTDGHGHVASILTYTRQSISNMPTPRGLPQTSNAVTERQPPTNTTFALPVPGRYMTSNTILQFALRKQKVFEHRRGGKLGIQEHTTATVSSLLHVKAVVLEEILQCLPSLVKKAPLESYCQVSEAFPTGRLADQRLILEGVWARPPRSLGTCGAGWLSGCRIPSTCDR
jgi:hypothetical protein